MSTTITTNGIIEWAQTYTGEKFHALLCDPPYHLSGGFMGKQWDKDGPDAIAFNPASWRTIGEHLHPGALGMAFASSRGWHRMAVAIEDAGFIIHPTVFLWAFGSGFPKASRIDTQIDKAAGAEREVVGRHKRDAGSKSEHPFERSRALEFAVTAPATDEARAWQGHRYGGQCLKPAVEPIIVFQKPYDGKPLASITRTGAGALNIDGARIAAPEGLTSGGKPTGGNNPCYMSKANDPRTERTEGHPAGRWPSNFVLSHHPECNGECVEACAIRRLGEQSGERKSGGGNKRSVDAGMWSGKRPHDYECEPTTGTAARFFFNADFSLDVAERLATSDPVRYVAKASRKERDAGLDAFEERATRVGPERLAKNFTAQSGELKRAPRRNVHPTVKPLALAQHLATLLLPPAEYGPRRLLVPFAGSGSECIGAMLAGWEVVEGIEREDEYADIARARIAHWSTTATPLAEATLFE